MLCLAVGLGILGFAAMRRAHRRCHGGGCGGYYGGYGGWHGSSWGHHGHHRHRPWMLYAVLERLDATPAQERAIVSELDRLKDRVRGARSGLADARGDLAAALRGSTLDEAALGAVLGRVDGATGEARAAILDALRNIHGVLDEKQRGELAELVDRGPGWFRGGWRRGPYR